jgi:poly-gamma-glutamate capsule biosynthesis protein CapA/YwtB (metallophosphatase superfamily)
MVMIGDTFVQRPDPDSAFAPVLPLVKDADIFFCNLETVIADAKYLSPYDLDRRPRTDEWIFPAYLRAGINVMNVANNPIMYHGLDCFLRCLDVLDEAGIVYGGGGRNMADARKPAIIERRGTRVAFVCRASVHAVNAAATAQRPGLAAFRIATAYEARTRIKGKDTELMPIAPGSPPIIHTIPNSEDRESLKEDIDKARELADVVVVSWHWGVSPATGGTGEELVGYQTEMGHAAIDFGADLVVGHHPHLLQPIELYMGKAIVYSLGNYVHDMESTGGKRLRKLDTMLLSCLISDGKIQRISFVPGRIEGHGPPRFFRPAEATDVVEYMRRISAPFGTQFNVEGEEVSVVLGTH